MDFIGEKTREWKDGRTEADGTRALGSLFNAEFNRLYDNCNWLKTNLGNGFDLEQAKAFWEESRRKELALGVEWKKVKENGYGNFRVSKEDRVLSLACGEFAENYYNFYACVSYDEGASWQPLPLGDNAPPEDPETFVQSLISLPFFQVENAGRTGGWLVPETQITATYNVSVFAAKSAVYVSWDKGKTFEPLYTSDKVLLDFCWRSGQLFILEIDVNELYSSTAENRTVTFARSRDFGASWDRKDFTIPVEEIEEIFSGFLAGHTFSQKGFLRLGNSYSFNDAASWIDLSSYQPLGKPVQVEDLWFMPAAGGVLKSADAGASWQPAGLVPQSSAGTGDFDFLDYGDGVLLACGKNQPPHYSRDKGTSWELIDALQGQTFSYYPGFGWGMPSHYTCRVLLLGGASALTEGGVSDNDIKKTAAGSGVFIAAGKTKIYVSKDAGLSWGTIAFALPKNETIDALIYDSGFFCLIAGGKTFLSGAF